MNTMPSLSNTNALAFDSLDSYLNKIKNIPILSAEREQQLFKRFQLHNDLQAVREIILSNLRFVAYIARKYRSYGLPLSDLIQEGNVGLMKSIKRFDPGKGVRIATFAIHWIKAEIHEFILKNWKLVKVATTRSQRRLFFNLKKLRNNINRISADEANMLADKLDVKPEEIFMMESRLQRQDLHFDPSFGERPNEEISFSANANLLEDDSTRPDLIVDYNEHFSLSKTALYQAMNSLDDRSRDIVTNRWLNDKKVSLKELAKKYNLSIERIRQIESSALEQLRERMPAYLAPIH